MITAQMVHEAFKVAARSRQPWSTVGGTSRKYYEAMAKEVRIQAGICPQCGCIPATGLVEVAGEDVCSDTGDCPGEDSGKWCCHHCVGAIIRNKQGGILMFQRGTYPFAMAGPAGHCDCEEPEAAVRKEVGEEVGLTVIATRLLAQFWHPARCRRRYAGMAGHHWSFFECVVRGDLHASERETQPDSLRFYTPEEVAVLVAQTRRYLDGEQVENHLDLPWYRFFTDSAEISQ